MNRTVLASAVALFVSLPASAAESGNQPDLTALPLEQLLTMEVYSASRFVQKASEAPSTVTVITAEDIRRFGWHNLADVARSVRGLYINNDRNYSYLGARGFLRPGDYNTRFLLQVDGLRINDALYDQALMGEDFPLDLELVERIEFVPGPGSSVYGSNAFLGVINVITRKARELDGVRATLEAGQQGRVGARASIAWRDAGGRDFLFAASRWRSKGSDFYYPEFGASAIGLDGERNGRLFFKARDGGLVLTVLHSWRDKDIPTASFGQAFGDPRSRTEDGSSLADLAWSGRVSAATEASVRAYVARTRSVGSYAYDGDTGRYLNFDGGNAHWWGMEAKLVATGFSGHKLVAGLDLQRDQTLDQFSYNTNPFEQKLDDQRSATRSGIYIQDEYSIMQGVLLNGGLRYDHVSGSDAVFSPRLALIWQLAPATTLKAIYGGAYRAPNAYERYYAFTGEGAQLANPALRKETIRSTEIALVHELGDARRLTLLAFRNTVRGLISQVPEAASGLPQYQNADHGTAQGLEFEYEQAWHSASLRASASRLLSHVESEIGAPEAGLQVNTPPWLAKFNLTGPLWSEQLQAGLEAQYIGARGSVNGTAQAYWLANLNLVTAHWRSAELALYVSNLFDRRYDDPGALEHRQAVIPQDGRCLRLTLRGRF